MFNHLTSKRKPNGRRAFGAAAASVCVHLAIVVLLVLGIRASRPLFADEGAGEGETADEAGGGGGGGGGGGEVVSYYELPPAPPPPPPPPPPTPEEDALIPPEEVVPPPPPPPVRTPPAEARPAAPAPPRPAPQAPSTTPGAGAGAGGGEGPGAGPGTGPGTGPGSGGGSGGGTGGGTGTGTGPGTGAGGISPPTWDFLIIPPQKPRGMAGRDLEIQVLVDERGAVKEVRIEPSSGNRGYDEQLRRMARDWRFNPARDAGNRPVEAWVKVTVSI